jgi:tetratricopeptide (TPR) repeat protein
MIRQDSSALSSRLVFSTLCVLAAILLGGCAATAVRPDIPREEVQALLREGESAYERMAFEEAWKTYSKAETLGVHDGILFYRVDVLNAALKKSPQNQGQVHYREETRRLLDEAHRSGKGGPTTYFYLAQVLESGKGNGSRRPKLYADAVKKFEAGGFEKLGAGDLEKLGRMYQFLGLPEQAERLFVQAREMDPHDAFAVYSLGKLFQETGRHRIAMNQFERFVGMVPRDAEGHVLLGENAYAAGEYARAVKAFETALALGSNSPEARSGIRRARAAVERHDALLKERMSLKWEVGFESRLSALTLQADGLRLSDGGVGPPALGRRGELAFASGEGRRFDLYTLSPNGVKLVRRATSTSGFTSFAGEENQIVVAVDFGPRREVGTFDMQSATFMVLHRGHCLQPNYSEKHRALLCAGPGGVLLMDPRTKALSTIFREPQAKNPRMGGHGQTIVLAERNEVIWLDRTGQEQGRYRFPGKEPAARYPDLSPDGWWIVSGENGLHLTSVKEKVSVALDHPGLRGAGRPTFGPEGNTIVFVKEGRLYRLELPKEMDSFFAFQHARELIREKKFGSAARLLKNRPIPEKSNLAYHLLLGEAMMGLNVFEEAEAGLQQAEKIAPDDWRPPYFLGKLETARKNPGKAIQHLNRAVLLAPHRYEVYLARAQAQVSRGRSKEAAQDFRAALQQEEIASGSKADSAVLGLLDAYVHDRRIDEALLLLLDRIETLTPHALTTIRTADRFKPLQGDSRFREVLGLPHEVVPREIQQTSAPRPAPREPAVSFPYRARVFIDENPNPIESEVLAEDGDEVTIRAFGVVEKYPRGRLRIAR